MEKFSNTKTFIKNNKHNTEKLPNEFYKLTIFTLCSERIRKIKYLFNNIKQIDNEYIFEYQKKAYNFKHFSDYALQNFDKKILQSTKRINYQLSRTLKLACSLDLVNPRVVIGNSSIGNLDSLILFQENDKEKIIDYARNLVMLKDDYYELFDFGEINIVDKFELYNIYFLMDIFNNPDSLIELLIFYKEIVMELSKKGDFEFLNEKYDRNGINKRNYLLIGDCNDCLYFKKEDIFMKYKKLIRELDEFTEKPYKNKKHISYDVKEKSYIFKEKNFGFFTFELLSDIISDKEVQTELLSKDRYHKCHRNSIAVASSLTQEDKETAYVVSGGFKENECDYFLHSWVEIDRSNTVIDFNHNLVMNRDKYYKLFEIKSISKIHIYDMEKIIDFVINECELDFHPMEINFFGQEIMRNLMKNEKNLTRKKPV